MQPQLPQLFSILTLNSTNPHKSKSCVGIFTDFSIAEILVINNASDIHECMYDYVLIEEIGANSIYFIGPAKKLGSKYWYFWNERKRKYSKCDEPDWAKNIHHWIG